MDIKDFWGRYKIYKLSFEDNYEFDGKDMIARVGYVPITLNELMEIERLVYADDTGVEFARGCGEWIDEDPASDFYLCSECDCEVQVPYDFCPFCGSAMKHTRTILTSRNE